jgi:hypothetical protein
MTYDLRRLRRKGFIQRIPRSQRDQLSGELTPLATSWRASEHALDDKIKQAAIGAQNMTRP